MRPTTRRGLAPSPPRKQRSRRESASWEHPQFTLFVALQIVEAPAVPDAFRRRKIMRLLDQGDPGRTLLSEDVTGIGLVPEPLDLLGSIAHVFGEHEISMIEQAGVRR